MDTAAVADGALGRHLPVPFASGHGSGASHGPGMVTAPQRGLGSLPLERAVALGPHPSYSFQYEGGVWNVGVSGDWDGNGTSTVGVLRD